ncbi:MULTISPECIES: 2-oxoglutarate synthase subunit alpha [unclassified Campylobacter]|uniref:2-oxoglutarate synthase subunit alpha n=1 Tax=unclassified Campylobacter TaxID=2593542 RepID=UPI001238178F|nr:MULTISPECIES: 2-oxoglutarate synthase subunit alpha [unclassified Campylobacter]KAA6225512.1 2-oxoglutarate synthase subunit alpha [Campylobacter sp. LR196d]KAA6226949.1 2-oxoglutarate synthase subunit alpha [Campylobacter sp. LR185c]KAA6229783.1 2-oxoglutarate synthase subunit alpha [Campylobacter sp. LR286c]KAA6234308.1 2-oxoglutarate synthase subunit alpha [Campylobacter sp. LR291e]KAA8604082.1 2-oxoglutarate synthase subunit alpha [Campylobacter sp. LR185c]
MREVIATGNVLIAQAAIDCGCRFFGGYPITPSSEIAHELSHMLPANDGTFIQMEDEISGISVTIGASMSGTKAMTASSGPGISLKAEQIGLAFIAEIPLVIVNVMRGGPSTGLPTRVAQGDLFQAKAPTHGDFASIAIAPASLEEAYLETVRAFNLAEKFMTPVFLLMDETVGHMNGKAVIPDAKDIEIINRAKFTGDKKEYKAYKAEANQPATLNPFFTGYRYHVTGLHHGEIGFPTEDGELVKKNMERLIGKIKNRKNEICKWEEYKLDDAEFLIIAYGSVSRSAKEAINRLREEGVKVGLFRPITLYPVAEEKIAQIVNKFKKVMVSELNMGQYLEEIERVSSRRDFISLHRANGRPITPSEIIAKIKENL